MPLNREKLNNSFHPPQQPTFQLMKYSNLIQTNSLWRQHISALKFVNKLFHFSHPLFSLGIVKWKWGAGHAQQVKRKERWRKESWGSCLKIYEINFKSFSLYFSCVYFGSWLSLLIFLSEKLKRAVEEKCFLGSLWTRAGESAWRRRHHGVYVREGDLGAFFDTRRK